MYIICYCFRSLGCIAYHLLCGKPPFDTQCLMHLVQMMKDQPIMWPNTVSSICRNFLEQLLQKNPLQRLTWPDLLDHEFVKDRVFTIDQNQDCCEFSELDDIVSPFHTMKINEEDETTESTSTGHDLTSIEDT